MAKEIEAKKKWRRLGVRATPGDTNYSITGGDNNTKKGKFDRTEKSTAKVRFITE